MTKLNQFIFRNISHSIVLAGVAGREGDIVLQEVLNHHRTRQGEGLFLASDLRFVKKITRPDFRAKNFTH